MRHCSVDCPHRPAEQELYLLLQMNKRQNYQPGDKCVLGTTVVSSVESIVEIDMVGLDQKQMVHQGLISSNLMGWLGRKLALKKNSP